MLPEQMQHLPKWFTAMRGLQDELQYQKMSREARNMIDMCIPSFEESHQVT